MSKEKFKRQKGITLIVLIITIIVMLILVAVTVTVALNGGLFSAAKAAKERTVAERDEENSLSSGRVKIGNTWYDSLENYRNGIASENQDDNVEIETGDNGTGGETPTTPLPDSPKVGDYVTYTPDRGSYTTNYFGDVETYTTDTSLQWRILSINESTGKIESLISKTAVDQFRMAGTATYDSLTYSENPDNLCQTLYSKKDNSNNLICTARGIKISDVDLLSDEQKTEILSINKKYWLSDFIQEYVSAENYFYSYQYYYNPDTNSLDKFLLGCSPTYTIHNSSGYNTSMSIRPVVDVGEFSEISILENVAPSNGYFSWNITF